MVIELKENLDAVEEGLSLPAGWYPVRIEEVNVEATGPQSKEPGTPMLHIRAVVLAGEYSGRPAFWRNVCGGGALGMLKRLLKAAGVPWSVSGTRTIFDETQLVGKQLQAKAEIEEYLGEKRNNWRSWRAIDATDQG